MAVESVSLPFPEFILKHCNFVRLNKSGNISTRAAGSPPRPPVMWDEIKQSLKRDVPKEFSEYSAEVFKVEMTPVEAERLIETLKSILTGRKRAETDRVVGGALATEFSPELPVQLKDLMGLKPINRDNIVYMYDKGGDAAQRYTQLSLDLVLGRFPEEVRNAWYESNFKVVDIAYDPNMPRFYREEGSKHEKFNFYTLPEWRKDWIPDYANSSLPDEVDFVFKHVLPCPDDRKYVFSWLRDMTFSRAEPILVFRGAPRIGKNLICEYIAGALVGNSGTAPNFHKAQRKFKESSFHGNLGECRMFLLDEVLLDEDLKETLKDYHNGAAALEVKFENMTAPKKLHCSIAAMANEKSKFKLSYEDKKFYVPTLCDVDMKDVKPADWIKHFRFVTLADPAYIQRIANYLHFHVESLRPPVETPAFLELCWLAMPAYMHKFLSLAVSKRCFDEREFRRIGAKGVKVEFEALREKVGAFGRARQIGPDGAGKFQVHESGWTFISNIYKRDELLFKDESVVRLDPESPASPDVDPTSPLGAN